MGNTFDTKKRGWTVTVPPMLLLFLYLAPLQASASSQVRALTAFKRRLSDPAQVLLSWDPKSASPCPWFRVTCNSEDQVIRIDLGNMALSGKLGPEIGRFPHLQYLELYSNNLSGTIPKQVGKLSALVSLDLYENNFRGTIPANIAKIPNLNFLRLNSNRLSGRIPVELTKIQRLTVLDLSYNNLSGPIPTNGSFSHFTSMSYEGNEGLCGPPTQKSCPISYPPLPAPSASAPAPAPHTQK